MKDAEAPAPSRVNAAVAGDEVSTPQADGATRALDLADTPASHIRNVRCILELAAEYTRNGLGKKDGSVVLDRQAVADIETKLGAALVLLDTIARAAQLASKLGFEGPVTVRVAEDGIAGMQTILAFAVPRQSAPAFAKQAGAR